MGNSPSLPAIKQCRDSNGTHLILRRKELAEIPDELLKLVQLRMLDVAGNALTTIPDLSVLSALEQLYVTSNPLTAVAQLPVSLVTIEFEKTALTRIPPSLASLVNVREISFAECPLHSIDARAASELPPNLRSLNLSKCQLESVHDGLAWLTDLRELVLSDNQLTVIPDLSALAHLGAFKVARNKLTAIPGWVGGMEKMEYLDFSGNPIDSVSDEVAVLGTRKMTSFDLRETALLSLPEPLRGLKFLLCDIPNEILPGLWLGSLSASRNVAVLQRCGINAVLCMLPTSPEPEMTLKAFKRVATNDTNVQDLRPHFDECLQFIEENRQHGVLVHCERGVSRSGSIVVRYVMVHNKLGYEAALAFVRAQRPIAKPNPAFEQQLRAFDTTPPSA